MESHPIPHLPPRPSWPRPSEDVIAIAMGVILVAIAWGLVAAAEHSAVTSSDLGTMAGRILGSLAKPREWAGSPLDALEGQGGATVATLVFITAAFAIAVWLLGGSAAAFARTFPFLFLLAWLSYLISGQQRIKAFGLEYPLWAIALGLTARNMLGVGQGLLAAARTELFIKTGLVVMGAEILLWKLWALGVPGMLIAWIVTPIVLITTFWLGQRILKIESPSLNMVISADMSVCGVSAAIATASACRATKQELSLAIGISMAFTALMMVVMPPVIGLLGLGPVIGGAWIGGTIDSTGAVGAAGAMLGETGLVVATTVKMIQNVLVGFVAFGVATYWTMRMEPGRGGSPDWREIWRRMPKFVVGFFAVSLGCSWLSFVVPGGRELLASAIEQGTKPLRTWCFCLAFVSIGLESDFRTIFGQLKGGKPLWLYVLGQTLNLLLSLSMCLLVFRVLFPQAEAALR